MDLFNRLKQQCELAIQTAFPDRYASMDPLWLEITHSTQPNFGHYQCNSPMKLAKVWGKNPRAIAEQILTALQQQPDIEKLCAQMSIAGPGFINFTIHPDCLSQQIAAQLKDPCLGLMPLQKTHKIVIDFSSPNIAKDMHVGHLRSTIIGDCLARVLGFMGHEVLRINHVGDWGTQFGMLIAYLRAVSTDFTLENLVTCYQAAKQRFDNDPAFKKQAQEAVVALQSGDPESKQIWEKICAISRQAYQAIYDRLDVHLVERGESFYNPLLAPLIAELAQKGLLENSEGAGCMKLEGFKNREGEPLPLILEKSDGGYNYATTDMAALRYRVQADKADWLIYVTDAGQSLHFQMIFEAAKIAGFYDPTQVRLDHVPFGLVLKTDGKKFQTRSGDNQRLMDLLDSAVEKAKGKILERNPTIEPEALETAAQVLGINAIKYADLSGHRLNDYVFNEDKMLQFEGNTAAFLLYAYVRIQSIQRKLNSDVQALLKANAVLRLEEPAEIALGLWVCQFGECLEKVAQELLPNRLSDYLYKLAEKFHLFFHQCRVEGTPQESSRLLLCEAVSQVLDTGLHLLGLKTLARM
ncbi:MAG: arginine--tRNA ligase [Gammaproteobacteria bacterium]|nr:arginine--tRNA ligase [Gammaproteobacteria bacterium]MBP9728866.1 arginine--tRNA ligase [Gammaproteobacteria bacterium]